MVFNNIKKSRMKIKTNKIFKIIILSIIMILLSFFSINQYSNATGTKKADETTTTTSESVGEEAIKKYMDKSKESIENDTETVGTLKNFFGAIRNVFQIVSMAIAIAMLTILAVKYIIASAEERAEIKKHALVYVLGAILIFATNGVISIIQSFSSNIQ